MSDRTQFHPDNMRKRFHELAKQVAELHAKSDPLRAQRDALVNKFHAEARPLEAATKEIEAPLFDMKMEQGALARALGGKTGKAPQ